MNILLTNDDGYYSSGLQILCSALAERGHNVYVVAPDGQRSGFSHAMDYNKDLLFKKLLSYCDATEAYICSGTPADCARIGIRHLGVQMDLVVAGPNNGANYGRALLCSGTVGAAEEATLCGVKSIALSRLERGGGFYSAVNYLTDNLDELCEAITEGVFLNINVPDLPQSQIKGVRTCPHSVVLPSFADSCVMTGEDTLRIVGTRNPATDEYTDVVLANQGYITITPLSVSRTDSRRLFNLRRLER